jgi:hypothetical protein
MKKFIIIGLLCSLNANAKFDFLEHSSFVEIVKKQIAKQTINVDLNILTLPLADGLTESLNAKAKSQPSYVNGYYTRLDQMNLATGADVNKLLDLTKLPFGFNMSHNAEIIFARQFKTQLESVKALPYNLFVNFPINAEKAKNNLNPGDFVSFHANLNFVISRGFFSYYNAGAYAASSAYGLVSGDFLINLFKMDDNKIRVKFIANRGKGIGASASTGYGSPFKLVGFNYIDRRITDWINLSASASMGKNSSDVFLIDFTFDLSDPKSATAFTNLMSKKAVFKDVSILNPFMNQDTLANKLMTDMSEVEELVTEDRDLPVGQRRINRVFKGSNSAEVESTNFSIGHKLFSFNANKSFVRNRISNVDKSDNKQKYLFDVFSKSHGYNALLDTFGSQDILNSNMLLTANEDWTPDKFVALALSREFRIVNFSKDDLEKIKTSVAQILPPEQYSKIDWKNWQFNNKSLLNASFKNTLFFHQEAMAEIKQHDPVTLQKMLYTYLEKGTRPTSSPILVKDNGLEDAASFNDFGNSWLDKYELDIKQISEILAISFSPEATPQERYNAFLQVKNFPIFLEKGAGFLISLVPQDKIENLVGYELSMSAKDVEAVSYKFGKIEQEDLYKSLLYIQSVINNRSFDLRLYTDQNGEFKAN